MPVQNLPQTERTNIANALAASLGKTRQTTLNTGFQILFDNLVQSEQTEEPGPRHLSERKKESAVPATSESGPTVDWTAGPQSLNPSLLSAATPVKAAQHAPDEKVTTEATDRPAGRSDTTAGDADTTAKNAGVASDNAEKTTTDESNAAWAATDADSANDANTEPVPDSAATGGPNAPVLDAGLASKPFTAATTAVVQTQVVHPQTEKTAIAASLLDHDQKTAAIAPSDLPTSQQPVIESQPKPSIDSALRGIRKKEVATTDTAVTGATAHEEAVLPVSPITATDKKTATFDHKAPDTPAALHAAPSTASLQTKAVETSDTAESIESAKTVGNKPGSPPFGLNAGATISAGTSTSATTVKIAAPLGTPRFPAEMSQKIVWMVSRDLTQADIKIHPEALGPINLKLQMRGNEAQLTIAAQDPQAQQLLSQAVPALKEILSQSGIQLNDVQVSGGGADGGASQSGSGRQQSSSEPSPQSGRSARDTLPAGSLIADGSPEQRSTTPGGVDLYA
ncbi:MAG: flagellar hook-length control protein FliK [Burkholderiaceae bacterium]